MNFDLIKPCKNCPFRNDIPSYLTSSRAEEISYAITERQETFSCHKTTKHNGNYKLVSDTKDHQHCAGALILLEKLNMPNQMMRWMERIGKYDRRKLKMDSPVFDTVEEFIDAQEN